MHSDETMSVKCLQFLELQPLQPTLKNQPHESDYLDERIVTISSKRVYGAMVYGVKRVLFAAKVRNDSAQ